MSPAAHHQRPTGNGLPGAGCAGGQRRTTHGRRDQDARRADGRPLLLVAVGQSRAAGTEQAAGAGDGQRNRRAIRQARDHVVRDHGFRARCTSPLGATLSGSTIRSSSSTPSSCSTWLARGEDPERVVDTLDRHLEATRARLDEALWSRQRSRELGITDDPDQRFSFAVLDYAIRGLYAEISNIAQLRDEIASGTSRDPVKRVPRAKGQIRRRAPKKLAAFR